MFTWKPIYREIAERILSFREKQDDLLKLVRQINAKDIPTIRLKDEGPDGAEIPLEVIDPFTFFANFSRGITNGNRIAILAAIKDAWSLEAALPADFTSIPLVHNMASWFFKFAKNRGEKDIDVLWDLAEGGIHAGPEKLRPEIFAAALQLPGAQIGRLTMGLYWLNPDLYLPLDAHTVNYLSGKGIDAEVIQDLAGYRAVLADTDERIDETYSDISQAAYEASTVVEVSIDDLDRGLVALLEQTAEANGMSLQDVADRLVGSAGSGEMATDVENRVKEYPVVRDLLLSTPLSMADLKRALSKLWIFATPSDGSHLKGFMESDGSEEAIQQLLDHSAGVPDALRIEAFIEYAATHGFHDRNGKPSRSGAAQLASAILSAVFPDRYVDFRTGRWEQLYRLTVGKGKPPLYKGEGYGERMQCAGSFAAKLATTASFRRLFGEENGTWKVAGLAWRLKGGIPKLEPPESSTRSYWIFQGNPAVFDVDASVSGNDQSLWNVSRHAGEIKPGDGAVIWRSGEEAGAIAFAEVSGAPTAQPDDSASENRLECPLVVRQRILPAYVPRADVAAHLPRLSIIRSAQGSNFRISQEEFETLKELADGLLPHQPGPVPKPTNTILYGPPGTGKTYISVERAVELCDGKAPANRRAVVARYRQLETQDRVAFVSFHQSYSYEEFVEGIRPVLVSDDDDTGATGAQAVFYECRDGLFKKICGMARGGRARTRRRFHPANGAETRVWKMSLGNAAKPSDQPIYDACLKENMILLGYGYGLDFTGCDTRNAVADKLREEVPDIRSTDYNITSVHAFKNDMAEGDIVVVPDRLDRFRAVGRIAAGYEFRGSEEYGQKRSVEWLLVLDESLPAERILTKQFSQQTLYELGESTLKRQALWDTLAETGQTPPQNYVLVIDEINRGNVAKILGEIITLLEPDKRLGAENEIRVTLPYSGDEFGVPPNLHIIGTMNTADRSIAFLDTALRRRFDFVEMMPNPDVIRRLVGSEGVVDGVDVAELLAKINDRVEILYDRDHQIGHSYFLAVTSLDDLKQVFLSNVIPLLQEYFYGDFEKLCLVLGCPYDPESGKPLTGNTLPLIISESLSVQDMPGYVHGEIDAKLRYDVNPAFTGATSDALRTAFLNLTARNNGEPPTGSAEP